MLRLCLVAVAIALAVAEPCDPDWRYSPSSNACYKLFNQPTGWTVAEFRCVFQGGAHHVTVHDYFENTFVRELAAQAGEVWIGAAQFGTNPTYVNADHTSFDYENWEQGFRPAFYPHRQCIKMKESGQWYQSCCKRPAAYICKRAASSNPWRVRKARQAIFGF